MMRSFVVLVFGLLGVLPLSSAQRTCNNSPALCDRPYNNITHLGAHDSPFVRTAANDFSLFGDQYYSSTTQLDAGVRLLTGQVHQNGSQWDLCHTACAFLDAGTLTSWLSGIKTWLDNNPNEVVTILLVNSDNADAATLDQQFQPSGIVDYAYVPPSTTAATSDWPTLSELIDQNKRLVVWIASLDPTANTVAPYLLDQFTFVFENNYDVTNPANFDCDPNRPSNLQGQSIDSVLSSGYLPLMNHFLYDTIGSGIEYPAEDQVNNTNAASGSVGNLGDTANNCTSFYGKPPTYILVDFFNVGRAIDTVDRLNGVTGQTSRRVELPDTVEESKASSTTSTSASSTPTPTSASTSTVTTPSGGSNASSSSSSSSSTGASTSTSGNAVSPTPSASSGSNKQCKRSRKRSTWAAGGAAVVAMV